jgi:hypothetical protein
MSKRSNERAKGLYWSTMASYYDAQRREYVYLLRCGSSWAVRVMPSDPVYSLRTKQTKTELEARELYLKPEEV